MLQAEDFIGDWRFERNIADRHGGQNGVVSGRAKFDHDGDLLRYFEEGQLRLGGGPVLTSKRSYFWRFGNRVDVMFEDGRHFHSFVPSGHGRGTDHPCGSDIYRVVYNFTKWPEWQSNYVVAGPRKDYTSKTVFTRT